MIENENPTVQTVKSPLVPVPWSDEDAASGVTEIRINELHLRHFKGIERFDLVIDGEDVAIHGDNGTGKTTVADAISWLLFDKDSLGRGEFGIKTLDEHGEPIHNLEHEVEGELEVNGKTITLRKLYQEKWVRKRGQATQEFSGHETQYWVDGVPSRKMDYVDRVGSMLPEEAARVLTDPFYFADRLHWQDRRTILIDFCGDVTDEDVIASAPTLSDLPDILDGRPMADARKVIEAKRRKTNEELKAIPVRIDEARRNLPDVSEIDEARTRKSLETLREKRAGALEEKVRIKAGGELAERRRELAEVETLIEQIRRRVTADADGGRSELRAERDRLQRELSDLSLDINTQKSRAARAQKEIEEIDGRLTIAREEWKQVNRRVFEHEDEDTCPACGQELPADQVEEAHRKAEEEFNAKKARALNECDERGKRLKKDRAKLTEDIAAAERAIKKLQPEAETLLAQVEKMDQQLEAPVEANDPADDPEYTKAQAEADVLRKTIAGLEEGNQEALEAVIGTIAMLVEKISGHEERLATVKAAAAARLRIKELEKEERRLAGQYEELERQLYLCDEFVRRKVAMLTDRINSRFDIARFKLFNELVNGGLEECCEVSVGGVTWRDLNHGAQINAGVDIINQLTEHYGVAPPIVIDQAESVTRIIPSRGQQIRLVVDKTAVDLTVNHHELAGVEQ